MKVTFKAQRLAALTLAIVFVLALPGVAFATDISAAADATSVKVGDTLTLTVIVSADHIAVADGVFTYDPALLSYVGSNGGASDGYINLVSAQKGGSSSLTAVIKFTAIAEGEAIINVSINSVLDYSEQALEGAEAGVSITIASSGAPAVTGGVSESTPTVNIAQTGVAAQNVMGTTAQMYIWRSLSSLTLPSGFVDRQVSYAGEYVNGAGIPDSEDIIVLYLSEDTGGNAGYYIYDEQKNVLFPYLEIMSVLAEYTLLWPDESLEVPEGYEEAVLTWKEKDMPAWKEKGSDAPVYLVYARDSSGEKGFFLYNTEDESVQRFRVSLEPAPEATPTPTVAPTAKPVVAPAEEIQKDTGMTIEPALFIALCAACAALVIAVAVLAALYGKKRSKGRPKDERSDKDGRGEKAVPREKKEKDDRAAPKEKKEQDDKSDKTVIHVKDIKF